MSESNGSHSYNIKSTYRLNNGLQIPRLGLGTWRAEPGVVAAAVKHSILNGYIHIDAAIEYGNQREVGQGIKEALKQDKSIKRTDLWITSKLWNTHKEPSRARQQIQQILDELGLDYLDNLLVHWPVQWKWDGKTYHPADKDTEGPYTIHDTWKVLEEFVKNGKLRSIGISNFNEQQTDEVLSQAEILPVMNQCESHPFFTNIPLQKEMEKRNIAFEAYCPLGNVSGNIDQSPMGHATIKSIAKKYNKTPAQVILRWHIQGNRIVIPKSSNPERVIENGKLYDFQLTNDEMTQIDRLDKGDRQNNPGFMPGRGKVFPPSI